MWYLYIILCSDGSFYTGITTDLEERIRRHNKGKGSKFTKVRLPVELMYVEKFVTKVMARNREIEVKSFSVENKKHLIKFGLGQRFPSAELIK